MSQEFNKEIAKMRSLMERMEGKMTPYEALVNEEKMINEALSPDRELITSNDFFDFKTSMFLHVYLQYHHSKIK